MENLKLKKAKVNLILNEPFFATLLLPIETIEDNTINTCCINGKQIKFNPDFIDSLPQNEVVSLLAHEIMHVAMLHHLRAGNKEHDLWNKACDYAINPLLKQHDFILPDHALIDSKYDNSSAEQIYKELYEDKQEQEQGQEPDNQSGEGSQNDNGNGQADENNNQQPDSQGQPQKTGAKWGEVEQLTTNLSEIAEAESEMKQQLVQAVEAAKQAGKGSAGLQKLVSDLLETKVNWREVLERFICEIARNDYTWSKPNPRYFHAGLYLPKLENMEVGNIIFIIDTSGSVNELILTQFTSELKEAMSIFNSPVTVIHSDWEVQKVEQLDPDNDISPVGGGGTDFRPAFDYINDNDLMPRAAIYLTDGYCSRYPEEPEYPVLWAVYNNNSFNPPFGEVIEIDD